MRASFLFCSLLFKGRPGGRSRRALNIPQDGYDEEEDCADAEDEAYLEALVLFNRVLLSLI